MKIAIIGAGISGVSAGQILQEQGDNVILFEKANGPGGLVKCDRINGHLFHLTGGHVFNAKDVIVNEWFWKRFDKEKEFISASRKAKILLGGQFVGYPIENYLYLLEKPTVNQILSEILSLQTSGYKGPWSYRNFASFLKGNFGETLYRLYFQPYNEKIWNCDLQQVPMAWLEGKLPMPDYQGILLSNIMKEEDASMVHSTFYYPKEGGSQFIINRLAEGLTIKSNCAIEKVLFKNGKWIVQGGDFDSVVYTGDVRALQHILELDNPALKKALAMVTSLKSNGTSNALCETDNMDLSWLYLPDDNTKAHRIIYTGNFSPLNNAPGKRKSCVVEFSGKLTDTEMRTELMKLPGKLAPVAFNTEPNSYIIQEQDTREKISQIKNRLEPLRFYLSGRFAEWEYYNMDKAILSALLKFKRAEHAI